PAAEHRQQSRNGQPHADEGRKEVAMHQVIERNAIHIFALTMRLSDAGLRCRQTKLIYPNHRLPPWLTEDATRDRSNRLLDADHPQLSWSNLSQCTAHFRHQG